MLYSPNNTVQYGTVLYSYETPWHTHINTESPFKAFHYGAYCRCDNWRLPWRAGTPSGKKNIVAPGYSQKAINLEASLKGFCVEL